MAIDLQPTLQFVYHSRIVGREIIEEHFRGTSGANISSAKVVFDGHRNSF